MTRWLVLAGALATLVLSGLIIANTLPYFSLGRDFAFLEEKGDLGGDPVWRSFFYIHITGGMLCLIAGPFLLSEGVRRRALGLHRALGKVYALAVLGLGG